MDDATEVQGVIRRTLAKDQATEQGVSELIDYHEQQLRLYKNHALKNDEN